MAEAVACAAPESPRNNPKGLPDPENIATASPTPPHCACLLEDCDARSDPRTGCQGKEGFDSSKRRSFDRSVTPPLPERLSCMRHAGHPTAGKPMNPNLSSPWGDSVSGVRDEWLTPTMTSDDNRVRPSSGDGWIRQESTPNLSHPTLGCLLGCGGGLFLKKPVMNSRREASRCTLWMRKVMDPDNLIEIREKWTSFCHSDPRQAPV